MRAFVSGRNIATFFAVTIMIIVLGSLEIQALSPKEELGKLLFFDENLSTPPGQSCAACHAPEVGFTGPDSDINNTTAVYPGVVHTRFGNRKPPTAAYGGDSPVLHYDESEEVWVGGMFWDGRATGEVLGDPLAEQAQGPFLNSLEQNTPMAKLVCNKVKKSEYAVLFEEVWGPGSLDPVKDVAGTYERIARSISAYEKSTEVNPFTSKYDYYLAGEVDLTAQELSGLALFNDPDKGNCAACHPSTVPSPLFTDFTYDNLGVPRNTENPFYSMPRKWNPDGADWIDNGLGGFLRNAGYEPEMYESEMGKVKVPTLRNVDLRPNSGFVKSYGHNGFFKSLKDIVHFYNTRDVEDWPEPEVPENVNEDELGDLGLTDAEEDAIVAFLKTLSDGYMPPSAAPPFVPFARVATYEIASGSRLFQNIPNPLNPETWIPYQLNEDVDVIVRIYDSAGRLARTLDLGYKPAGFYTNKSKAAYWDGKNEAGEQVSSGVYFYTIQAGEYTATRKMVVTR